MVSRLGAAPAARGPAAGARPAGASACLGLRDAAGTAAAKRGVAGYRLQPAGVSSATALRRRLLLVPRRPQLRIQVA